MNARVRLRIADCGSRIGAELDRTTRHPHSAVRISTWALVGLTLALAGCRPEKPVEKIAPLVEAAPVEPFQGEAAGARYSATIVPYTEVPLAFKVEGYVTYIRQVRGSDAKLRNLQGGDRVKAGEVLARVRQVDYVNPVDQARAQVDQSRAASAQTQAGVGQGQAEVRRAQADRRAAASAQKEAEAALQLSQSRLAAAQAQEQAAASALGEAEAGLDQARAEREAAEVARRQAEAALDQTQESLRRARAALTGRLATEQETRLTFERHSNLFRSRSTTKSQLDQVTASYEVAQSQVEQARAQIGELEAKVQQAREEIQAATAQIGASQARIKASGAKIEQAKAQGQSAAASVRGARADVEGSQAKITGATERVASARAAEGAAVARLTGARAEVRGASAQVRSAQAVLRGRRVPLADTELRAPMDGLILNRNIEIGTLVQGPSFVDLNAAFTLANTSRVKAVFGVPDVALPDVRAGATYAVTSEALPGQRFQGTVTAIKPAADPKSRVFQVEVSIANPQRKLQSGMIVTLEVPGGRVAQPVEVVPLSAVVRAPGTTDRYAVFVVEQSGTASVARARTVELGPAVGNNRVQVLSGLQPGDRVIVGNAATLQDGQAIRVQP